MRSRCRPPRAGRSVCKRGESTANTGCKFDRPRWRRHSRSAPFDHLRSFVRIRVECCAHRRCTRSDEVPPTGHLAFSVSPVGASGFWFIGMRRPFMSSRYSRPPSRRSPSPSPGSAHETVECYSDRPFLGTVRLWIMPRCFNLLKDSPPSSV